MKFNKILFVYTLILSSLIVISSYSWLSAWIGLEVNLMSFIPLMKTNKLPSSESMMKYFITQALSSATFLFSTLLMLNTPIILYQPFAWSSMMILNSSLFLKMGAAPFHFWLPEIIEGLSWSNSLALLTWQKIAPMILLMYNLKTMMLMNIVIIYSVLIGGIQGLNQSSMRKIMAYSSISHIGWMLASMLNSLNIWILYFSTYSLISLNLILIFYNFNIFTINQLMYNMNLNKLTKMLLVLNFMNLGGLPPLLGFLPKWFTINSLIENNFFMMSLLLLVMTLITLYYYMRLMLPVLTINLNESLIQTTLPVKFKLIMMNSISLMSLILCTILYSMF